jgi:L-2,4-diaminobutyric acid acetyltransferase
MDVKIRLAVEDDFLDVYKFVSNCKPLESYSEHFYKIMLRYFSNCCFIAEYKNDIVGLITGVVSQVHDKTYFMWQIGVKSSIKGKGVAKNLLEKAEEEVKKLGCNRIELTVNPENITSQRFFEKNGYLNISPEEGDIIDVMGKTAVKDYYKPGRHFILFQKELI